MERKKRILFLIKFPLYGGGSGTFTRRLAEKLAASGDFEVAIASPDKREIKIPGIKIYRIRPSFQAVFESHPEWKRAERYSELDGFHFIKQFGSFLSDINKIVEDFKPDVLHINHAHFLTWIASMIKSIYGIGYIVTVHGTDIFNATIDRRYFVLTRQAVERAEQIIAVSPHTKKWFLKVYGKKLLKKTRIIAHGIDAEQYSQDISTKSIEEKYKIKGKKLIVFVGRLTKEKGLEYLIRAARKIKAEIFIIGDGTYKDYLANYTELVNATNVHFLGYFGQRNSNQLKQFYQKASVFVLPSVVDESLGLVVLEAMAAQTPVVASNKGGIPLVVKDGYNGLLVRARSAKAIACAINKILKDEKLAEKLSENATKTISQKFDWRVIVPQYENIYRKVSDMTSKLQKNQPKHILASDEVEREQRELAEKIELK